MDRNGLLETITKAMPYPGQITDWDVTSEDSIRFSWRGNRFRVSKSLSVEQVESCFLRGSDIAIILESLLRRQA